MPVVGSNTVFEFSWVAEMDGQTIRNVYHIGSNTPEQGIKGAELSTWLRDTHISELLESLVNDLTSVSIDWTEITGFTEGSLGYTDSGNIITEAMPIFNAVGVYFPRVSRETGSGWKRFAGIPQTAVAGNVLDTAFRSAISVASVPLIQDIELADGTIFNFYTLRKTYVIEPDGSKTLNPPELWIYTIPQSLQVRENVTSQNTRKLGSGE